MLKAGPSWVKLKHHEWKRPRGFTFRDLYQGEEREGRHPPAFPRYMGSRLHAETGCRKVYAGEVSERQKNPMAAKEKIGYGGGRKLRQQPVF